MQGPFHDACITQECYEKEDPLAESPYSFVHAVPRLSSGGVKAESSA